MGRVDRHRVSGRTVGGRYRHRNELVGGFEAWLLPLTFLPKSRVLLLGA